MEFLGKRKAGERGSVTIRLAIGSLASFAKVSLSHIDKFTQDREPMPIKSLTNRSLAEWEISNDILDGWGWGVNSFEFEVTAAGLSDGNANLLLTVSQDGTDLPAEDDNDQPANSPPEQSEVDLGQVPVPSLRHRAFRIFFRP